MAESETTERSRESGESKPPEGALIVHKTLAYRFIQRFVQLLLFTYCRLSVQGRENVPVEGGALIASNHQSFIDIPIVAAANRRHVCFVARDTLARTRWLAWVMRQCGAVLIGRGTADRRALRGMAEHLKQGDLLAIFPEGTRTQDGALGEFKGGAVLTAKLAEVPIIPAGITGAYDVLGRGKSFPRPRKVRIRYGAPIDPRDPEAHEKLVSAVEALMSARGARG